MKKQTKLNNEKLREKREMLGLTQDQLAKILDTTRNTIARWERGEVHPQSWNMLWLALNALEVAKNNKGATKEVKKLSLEVDAILAKIDRNSQALQADITRMKKTMNLNG